MTAWWILSQEIGRHVRAGGRSNTRKCDSAFESDSSKFHLFFILAENVKIKESVIKIRHLCSLTLSHGSSLWMNTWIHTLDKNRTKPTKHCHEANILFQIVNIIEINFQFLIDFKPHLIFFFKSVQKKKNVIWNVRWRNKRQEPLNCLKYNKIHKCWKVWYI